MARISESTNKLTHITYTNIDDFLNILRPYYFGDKIVNDIMMQNDYIFSFLDEYANLYHRLVLKTAEEHTEVLRRIHDYGYLVVVI